MKAKLDYQDLRVSLAEWKINTFRYDAYVRSVVLSQLNQAQKELLAAIVSEDMQSFTKRQLDGLVKEIGEIVDDNYDRISSFLDKTNKEFFITSHQVEAFVYNEWLGVSTLSALPKYKLEAIKVTPLFEGRALGDWWDKQKSDLKFNLETIIRNGNVVGETQANIAREVRHRIGVTASHAETLVRTANASISSAAQAKLMEINTDIIQAKQHLSTLDSRTCFVAGTEVLTPSGKKNIEDLRRGDFVVGGISGKTRKVLGVSSKKVNKLLRLTLDNGEIITCTPDHLFLTSHGWVEAEMLGCCDIIKHGEVDK